MRVFMRKLGIAFIVVGLVVGCSPSANEEERVEATATSSEELVTNDNVRRALDYGKSVVGTNYGWWFSGPLPAGAPMWTAAGPEPSASFVRSQSTNCAGLTNLLLRSVGKAIPSDPWAGRGGTGAYGRYYAKVAQKFNVNANYPAGTLIGRYFRNTYDQGHVAVILENGHVLQSYANCRGCAAPGVNTWSTLAQSHAGYFYEYAVLPQDWLGGSVSADKPVGDCKYGDGLYCGHNGVEGKTDTLYRCSGGKATVEKECYSGCVREEAGTDDHCAVKKMECKFGDGLYCGSSNGVAGHPNTLYRCTSGEVEPESWCENGCVTEEPGVADHCK
jgi:hypothetical protein